jgi:hypothetical protein
LIDPFLPDNPSLDKQSLGSGMKLDSALNCLEQWRDKGFDKLDSGLSRHVIKIQTQA